MKRRPTELNTVIWKEGKFFVAQCLNVDVSSFGKTKKEALGNIDEALALYFEEGMVSTFRIVENPKLVSLTLGHA